MEQGKIIKVAGPLVVADGLGDAKMFDLVKVGTEGLMGEIIEMRGDRASIQVYEETEGIGPGDPVEATGAPLSVELGPGMLGAVYDGVQRPLDELERQAGSFLARGISAPGLDRDKRWEFVATAKAGDRVEAGDIIGTVQENEVIEHRIMVPPGMAGEIVSVTSGSYTVTEAVATLRSHDGAEHELTMLQRWPVRIPRPYAKKVAASEPLVTGTRVIDTFFPLVKGGAACIPGPFGAGKTVTQHQVAKWSNAQVVIFIGCGERGNEMTDVLMEFPELVDPYSGEPLMKRTVLVANTSNMPVAAREASRLHRHHDGRVLPRHGLRGRAAGRLDVALGRGDARDLRPPRGDAGRGGLPRVPGHAPRRVLRARGQGRDAGRLGRGPPDRLRLGRRLGLASGRRPLRAGRAEHPARGQGVLGAAGHARVPAPLPGDRLAHQLLALPRQGGAVLGRAGLAGVPRAPRPLRWRSCSARASLPRSCASLAWRPSRQRSRS